MRNATMYRFNDRNHNISNPLNEPKLFETVHEHKECCKEQEGAPLNVLQQGLPLCVCQLSIPVLIYPSQTLYLFRRTRSKRASVMNPRIAIQRASNAASAHS